MRALGNDVLVVGGNSGQDYLGAPFVARLLGNAAGGSPGVLSMQQDRFLGTEQAGKATISVRRIGGTKGAIAASYSARDLAARELAGRAPASKGQDYTAIAGRLTWADGDDSDREIVVPIASDTLAEPPEFFELVLDTPEGGAGLGAYGTEIEIAGEGYPAGLLTIRPVQNLVAESGQADFQVDRESYSAGIVTVTVRVAGGSATPGQDFASPGESTAWRDVVITFQNNETQKLVPVPVLRDGKTEGAETFTLELCHRPGARHWARRSRRPSRSWTAAATRPVARAVVVVGVGPWAGSPRCCSGSPAGCVACWHATAGTSRVPDMSG